MRGRAARGILALSAPLFLACSEAGFSAVPERWELYDGLHAAGRFEARVPLGGTLEKRVRHLARRLESETPFRCTVRGSMEGSDSHAVRLVFGTLDDPTVSALAHRTGVEPLLEGGFSAFGRSFVGPGDAFVATFEDPFRSGLPLVLYGGNDEELLARYVTELPAPWQPELKIWTDGELTIRCPLARAGRPFPGEEVDHGAELEAHWRDAFRSEVGGLVVWAKTRPDGVRWQVYARALWAARASVATWLGAESQAPVRVYLYEDPGVMHRVLGRVALSLVNPVTRSVHVLLAEGLPDDGGAGVARAVALESAGEPVHPWMLEGIGVAAAGSWWNRPLKGWLGYLKSGDLVPPVQELVGRRATRTIDVHRRLPLLGGLWLHLVDSAEPTSLRGKWTGEVDLVLSPEWFAGFERTLSAVSRLGERVRADREGHRQALLSAPPWRGVALWSGARGFQELETTALRQSVSAASELGADALSVTVFASTAMPAASPFGSERAVYGNLADLEIAAALREARHHGMRSLLAVEPLADPGGSWADDVMLPDVSKLAAFFDDYRRILLRYALLAELLRVDVLCVGSELREVSLCVSVGKDAPGEEARAFKGESWRDLIQSARGGFSGALTYAARTGTEAPRVCFWEELDFVGLNFYSRIAVTDDPIPRDQAVRGKLKRSMETAVELGEKAGRPVVCVQLGFPSRAEAWDRPAVPRGPIDLESQRRFYALLSDVLEEGQFGARGLKGILLWNWSPDPEAGGPEHAGYTPQGKPAEGELARFFALR